MIYMSVADLFCPNINVSSLYLKRYDILIPHVTKAACSLKVPAAERVTNFRDKQSYKSSHRWIKAQVVEGTMACVYDEFL